MHISVPLARANRAAIVFQADRRPRQDAIMVARCRPSKSFP